MGKKAKKWLEAHVEPETLSQQQQHENTHNMSWTCCDDRPLCNIHIHMEKNEKNVRNEREGADGDQMI